MIADKLIVALDFDNVFDAMKIVTCLRDNVFTYKIGIELGYDRDRDTLIRHIREHDGRIFLDLKLHDIPETVERTVRKIVQTTSPEMLSVYGYPDTMYAAARGVADSTSEIYGISILTSYNESNLRSAGYTVTSRSLVGQRTDHAVLSGMTGLVCAVDDAKIVRSWSRSSLKLISPGIRLPSQDRHDQARVATPAQAMKAGVDYMIVGRPITRSDDPRGETEKIIENASSAL